MIGRLRLFFGGEAKISSPPVVRRRSSKYRDPDLEKRAKEAIHSLAPELSSRLLIGWNPRMRTTAGVAIAARWEIWLNPALREVSQVEIERTLLHELAHLLAQFRCGRRRLQPHGAEWRQACRDLGIANESRTHQLPFPGRKLKRRYRLSCPVCGESHERVRMPKRRVACLACCRRHQGGVYHERFRLVVQKIL
jgi:predicted SprT family Zn-dependent metalloprotease